MFADYLKARNTGGWCAQAKDYFSASPDWYWKNMADDIWVGSDGLFVNFMLARRSSAR